MWDILFPHSAPYFLRQGLSLNLELADCPRWMATELQDLSCPCCSTCALGLQTCACSDIIAGYLNSDSWVFKAGTVPTQPPF